MPNELDRFKKKGLPGYIPIDKSKYTGFVSQPEPETEEEKFKRTASMAGIKPVEPETKIVGLPETTTPFSEAKKRYNETIKRTSASVTPTEEYVSAPGGTSKPYGYPEEGKVYTEEDLGKPMTGGGFGYVSRGLPEAKATIEDYYKETITKMQDRADKLALQIESGFAKGKRLTSATEELKGIQSAIPLLMQGLTEAGVGVRGKEAEIGKTEAEKTKLERETAGLPRTPEEAKTFIEAKGEGKGMEAITYTEYIKGLNRILTNPAYLTEEDRQAALEVYKTQYPQYNVPGGLPNETGEEKEVGGIRYRWSGTKWQRFREE